MIHIKWLKQSLTLSKCHWHVCFYYILKWCLYRKTIRIHDSHRCFNQIKFSFLLVQSTPYHPCGWGGVMFLSLATELVKWNRVLKWQCEILQGTLFPLVWQLGMFETVEPGGPGWWTWAEPLCCPGVDRLHQQKINFCCFKPLAFGILLVRQHNLAYSE